jgi:hypothetical protein
MEDVGEEALIIWASKSSATLGKAGSKRALEFLDLQPKLSVEYVTFMMGMQIM